MGWDHSARRHDRGGEIIPPLRTIRLWLAAAVIAVLLAVGLAVYPALRAGDLLPAAVPLGVVGVAAAIVAVIFHGRLAGVALFALAAEYVVVEATSGVEPVSIVIYAAGLLVMCELLLWTGQLPRRGLADRAIVVRRIVTLGLMVVAAVLLAIVALAAAGVGPIATVRGVLIGVTAAVVALLLPWLLVRRRGA